MTSKKNPDSERLGGPGAAHENRREPEKSKPHGELPHEDANSGNRSTRFQEKKSVLPLERGHSHAGDTGKDDDPVKPKDRRQVR